MLLIDEAYRLAEGRFAQEAIDELVDCLTKDAYKGKLIVILAGYEDDINRLLSVNRGLASRFSEEINFKSMSAEDCFQLLTVLLKKQEITLVGSEDVQMVSLFRDLALLPSWGNARDVESLAKKMTALALEKMCDLAPTAAIELDTAIALRCMQETLLAFKQRARPGSINPLRIADPAEASQSSSPTLTPTSASSSSTAAAAPKTPDAAASPPTSPTSTSKKPNLSSGSSGTRDAEVTDDVWKQLQKDVVAAAALTLKLIDVKRRLAAAEADRRRAEEEEARQLAAADAAQQARAKAVADAARKRAQALAADAQRREEARRKEERVQERIREMGVCNQGYKWIKQASGYRCAGGSHYISDSQLGI